MDLISTTCIHDIDGIHYLKILLILFSINMMVSTLKCYNDMNSTPNNHKFGHKKHIHPKFDFDKMLYRKKIQSVFFVRHDKPSALNIYQDILDMSQYFKNEDILYEVLSEMEHDMVFDEICLFYREKRKTTDTDDLG